MSTTSVTSIVPHPRRHAVPHNTAASDPAPGARAPGGATYRAIFVALAAALALPANAGLLREGQAVRVIPLSIRDGDKPMVEASIGGRQGVLMIDNGTPDLLFLNRAALALPEGRYLASGFAASGQAVHVQAHPAPRISIAGQPLDLSGDVRSGDFGFTAPGLGTDFLGFIGTPMVADDAFLLDYRHRRLLVLQAGEDGALAVASPGAPDVVVSVPFMLLPGEQPTIAASVGTLPFVTDFDTGDSGTLYASAATRDRLRGQGLLEPDGDRWRLGGLAIDGVGFAPTLVRLVIAGSPQDVRKTGHIDQLRLGARFLSANPCLWNFPARTLTFLKPDAAFLDALATAGIDPPRSWASPVSAPAVPGAR